MIVIDTCVWIWWVNGSPELTPNLAHHLAAHEASGIGVCTISCWEVAKLVEKNRLQLTLPTLAWVETALKYPGVVALPLTAEIAVAACELPSPFHRDPADQIIVATARQWDAPVLTLDAKILDCPHVKTLT